MARKRDENWRALFHEQLRNDRQTFSVGERQVEQSQVGTLGSRNGQRFGHSAGYGYAMTGRLKQQAPGVTSKLIVFDDQYVIPHKCNLPAGPIGDPTFGQYRTRRNGDGYH